MLRTHNSAILSYELGQKLAHIPEIEFQCAALLQAFRLATWPIPHAYARRGLQHRSRTKLTKHPVPIFIELQQEESSHIRPRSHLKLAWAAPLTFVEAACARPSHTGVAKPNARAGLRPSLGLEHKRRNRGTIHSQLAKRLMQHPRFARTDQGSIEDPPRLISLQPRNASESW